MATKKLSKSFLEKEYKYSKKKAFYCFIKNQFEECLCYIKFCGRIAWEYPILFNFCDNELEDLLCKVKDELNLSHEYNQNQHKKKVIFYNSQLIDSGALTEQYLHYFMENNYQVLFIVPDIKNTEKGQNILHTIRNHENIELFIPDVSKDINKIEVIDSIVRQFGATNSFLHFVPNDVVGFTVFSDLTFLKKYYIVHNDHTFWFGKNCSDFFLEFRNFGCRVSVQRRLIDYKKIYSLPYYPIIQKTEFHGFPFDPKQKIIGFSGANLYKYYLDPELKFFYAIKELLLRNNDFVFCLAGFGDSTIVEKFIKVNELQDRFFFLGRRNDFYSLVGNIDILFESYPLKGGLTVLYAVENQKAITGIANNKTASGCIEDFFGLNNYEQAQNFNDFIKEADLLIKDKEFRSENARMFAISRYKKSLFDNSLSAILSGSFESIECDQSNLLLDDNDYLNEYISLPNTYFLFYYLKLTHLKNCLPFFEKVTIIIRLVLMKPIGIKKRLIRYIGKISPETKVKTM